MPFVAIPILRCSLGPGAGGDFARTGKTPYDPAKLTLTQETHLRQFHFDVGRMDRTQLERTAEKLREDLFKVTNIAEAIYRHYNFIEVSED